MKKMSFTNSMQFFKYGKPVLALLFVWCCFGLQLTEAQVVKLVRGGDPAVMPFDATAPHDTLANCYILPDCNEDGPSNAAAVKSLLFTDDGNNDGNYADPIGHQRRDTVEICPQDKWHYVKVVFTKFDLEDTTGMGTGDTLIVYQGDKAAVRDGTNPLAPAGSGTGVGVSKAFGGWIYAACDPDSNATGCLTFVFKTDGDNAKGAGWEAWVDCAKRDITVVPPSIPSVKLVCDSAAFAVITIDTVQIKGCGTGTDNVVDSVILRVTNQHGVVCINDTCIGGVTTVTDTFAIGSYKATWKLKSDPTKTAEAIFSVQAPSLVCNDDIIVPLGSACMIVLTPDDILEQPCDTVTDTMYYNITITLGSGKTKKELKTTGFADGNAVVYPIITQADIKAAGMTVCNATAKVTIERIYYGRAGTQSLATICGNGVKSTSCSTNISFSDKSDPWINITPGIDTLIACDTTGLAALLNANAIDNCDDDIKVTYTVTIEEMDPCFKDNGKPDTTTASVIFRAEDDCGNITTLPKTITIIRPDATLTSRQFVALTKDVQAECSDTDPATIGYPGLKIGTWQNGMFNVKDTITLSTEKYICGYILTKKDVEIPANDCGKKKYRYWSILDWCTPEDGPTAIDTTFIHYTDTKKPTFTDTISKGNLAPQDLELGHFSCHYDITKLTLPKATDNCTEKPTVRLDRVVRIEDGNMTDWVILPNAWDTLNCDSFKLRWIAEDDCHEQDINDTVYQIVVVKDVTKPSAVCTDQLNVSLPNEWGARICVKDVDAGSYDACGITKKEIRIKGKYSDPNAGWAECVDIGCEYVHPDLQIEMRVFDKNMTNYNICWLDVLVEDKIKPVCYNLDDKEDYCDKFHNGELGLSTDADEDKKFETSEYTPVSAELLATYVKHFGAFKCEDNLKTSAGCGELTEEEDYQLIEWPCGEIEIKRRHRAKDWSGNWSDYAYQNIKIKYRAGWKITLPSDWEGECEDNVIPPDITIDNGACDLLGFEVTKKVFEIPGDACFKMERTYHIINWCKYKAGEAPTVLARTEGEHGFAKGFMLTSEGNEDVGYFTYIQILKVHDDEAPVVTVHDPDPCINGIEFDALPYGEEDITPGTTPYECDEPKTWWAEATDCSDQSAITWIGKLYDVNGNVVKTVETNTLTYVVSNKETYYAEFWAYDGCGNSGGAKGGTQKFWDCKKPTPYVLNGIAVEIMQAQEGGYPMIGVWVTDVNQNSFDNCTDQSKLDLRIWHQSLGDAPTSLEGVYELPKLIEFTCEYLGTQVVNVYVIDEEDNWDYAATYVIIQDNMGACGNIEPGDGNMVAGTIVNPNSENVQSVSIAVNGAEQQTMTTAEDGKYLFMLPNGGDYTITPEKDINPLNGVSTFDLVLISKHILGISTFDTPYKYIAADVNKSGSITAFDMVQLRQLILNITSEFPNNSSWRFVESGYEFTSANPAAESFHEFMSINNLNAPMENMDFVAVKIGDVNGNALANSLLGADVRNTNQTLTINVRDRFVEAGQTVTVEFTSTDIASAQGYQFTMNFAGLELTEVVEGVAKAANFNTNLAERGVLTTSWNGEATANDVLFSLTFKATTAGLLSDLVSVNSDLTTAEAYNTDGELMNVNIKFNSATTAAGFELNQNTPNPFKGETVIGFNLPQAGTATLKVMDVQGKVLKSIKADYAKGYNQVSLNANELGATGVLYYQLESAENVATKKMIIIE